MVAVILILVVVGVGWWWCWCTGSLLLVHVSAGEWEGWQTFVETSVSNKINKKIYPNTKKKTLVKEKERKEKKNLRPNDGEPSFGSFRLLKLGYYFGRPSQRHCRCWNSITIEGGIAVVVYIVMDDSKVNKGNKKKHTWHCVSRPWPGQHLLLPCLSLLIHIPHCHPRIHIFDSRWCRTCVSFKLEKFYMTNICASIS